MKQIKPPHREEHEQGSVLIIVAGVLAALSLMALTFSALARIEMRSAQNVHDKQMAIAAARAGVGVAMEMVAQDETLCDDWRDPWFTPQYRDPNRVEQRPMPTQSGSHRSITAVEGTLRAVSEIGAGINEDPPGDANGDGRPGIKDVDDDGDGLVDEDNQGREPDDPGYSNDLRNDDDEDGRVDEDNVGDANEDGAPGVVNYDDDGDGFTDECAFLNKDMDGDGKIDEDPPGDYVGGPYGTQWSEDRGDEGAFAGTGSTYNIRSEDYPSVSLQRNYSYQTNLTSFYDWMSNRTYTLPDSDGSPIGSRADGLVDESMYLFRTDLLAANAYWNGLGQVYPFMDGDDAEGQRRVDENCDGCADGWATGWPTPANPAVYNLSQERRFYRADEDNQTRVPSTTGENYAPTPSAYEPEGYAAGKYNRFRSFAGCIYGQNAEDDDEDSDNLTPDENMRRDQGEYWWKVGQPTGFIRDEASKINLNVHGSLYDPALFFDPETLQTLGRRNATGAPNYYTGYAQSALGPPYHDVVNPISGGAIGSWNDPEVATRKDIYGWSRDGRMYDQGFDVSLVRFFRTYGFTVRQAQNFALAVVRYRYGPDGAPGWRGVDDDFDNMRPGDNANFPTGDCVYDGVDNDGDWRGWRFPYGDSHKSETFQDQGVDLWAIAGRFVRGYEVSLAPWGKNGTVIYNSFYGFAPVFWPGRWDNCPTFFRLTGCPRVDAGEVNGVGFGRVDGQVIAQEGLRVWRCGGCGHYIGSALSHGDGSVPPPPSNLFECPLHYWGSADDSTPGLCSQAQNVPDTVQYRTVDEPTEGIDEDDEYDPLYAPLSNPFGRSFFGHAPLWRRQDGSDSATAEPTDDRRFGSIKELVDALLDKRDARTGVANANGETAVSYARFNGVDDDYDGVVDENDGSEEYAEAWRVFNIVKEDMSVEIADLDIGLININVDSWGYDGLDNDNDGAVDAAADGGPNPGSEDMTNISPAPASPAAEFPRKVQALAQAYRDCGIIVSSPGAPYPPLPAGEIANGKAPYLNYGHMANIVDFQDKDPFPTALYYNDQEDSPYYFGTEGVHLNEVLMGAARAGDTANCAQHELVLQDPAEGGPASLTDNPAKDGWIPDPSAVPGMFIMNGNYKLDDTWDTTTNGEWITGNFTLEGVPRGCYVAIIYGNSAANGPGKDPLEVWIEGNEPGAHKPAGGEAFPEGEPLSGIFDRPHDSAHWVMHTTPNTGWYRRVTIFNDLGPDEFGATDFGSFYINRDDAIPGVPRRLGAIVVQRTTSTASTGTIIRVAAKQPIAETDPKPQFSIRPLNWFLEFVNISRKPIKLIDRGVNEQGDNETLFLEIGDTINSPQSGASLYQFALSTALNPVPRVTATWCPPGRMGNERLPVNGVAQPAGETKYIPAAHADGHFPPNYGYFVIALCEDAYDKTWGNGSGHWGDDPRENYPVYFTEYTGLPSSLGNPPIFMMGRRLFQNATAAGIRLYSRTGVAGSNGRTYLAGSWIDAFEGMPTASGPNGPISFDLSWLQRNDIPAVPQSEPYSRYAEFSSIEKIAPVVPIWKTYLDELVTFEDVWKQNRGAGNILTNELANELSAPRGTTSPVVYLTRRTSQGYWTYYRLGNTYPVDASTPRREANAAQVNCVNSRWKAMDQHRYLAGGGTSPYIYDYTWSRRHNYAFIRNEKIAPMVWDGPFLSVGWLAFVPACDWGPDPGPPPRNNPHPEAVGSTAPNPADPEDPLVYEWYDPPLSRHPWRNFTPRPHMADVFQPYVNPLYTLLGARVGAKMGRASYPLDCAGMRLNPGNWRPLACVPGVRAKININTASTPTLLAAFPSGIAAKIVKYRPYRCAEDIMGFPSPDVDGMLTKGQIASRVPADPRQEQRATFIGKTTVRTGWVDFRNADYQANLSDSTAGTCQGNYVMEQWSKADPPSSSVPGGLVGYFGNPLFSRYAFETHSTDGSLLTITHNINGSWDTIMDRNEDHDDSGAGMMLDDVACDITEQLEWYIRYCNVIDIKSRFFTVYSRGQVHSPSGLCATARVKAVIERPDDLNNEQVRVGIQQYYLLSRVPWYDASTPFAGPNGRAEGVTLRSIESLDN